jgi:hypothetical protein
MADATVMYTNINTEDGLQAFHHIFTHYDKKIPDTFPKELLITVLELIMNNTVLYFGDTYWHQLHGIAMGTPAVP